MSYDIGRYTVALMWFKQLTGADISDITAVPAEFSAISQHLPAIKDAVNKAYEKKLEISLSDFPPQSTPTPSEPSDSLTTMTEVDKTYLNGLGLNPDDYKVLDLKLTIGAYYFSTQSKYNSQLITTEAVSPNYIATGIFSANDLPVGSVINIANGYQYRMEGWQTLNEKNSQTRKGNSTSDMTVTASLYEKYSYIAFNISKTAGSTMSEADQTALRIYVPVSK